MRLHRFYIKEVIQGTTVKIDNKDLIHQWRNVFRYTTGGQVIVFNGDGMDYFCLISEMYSHTAELSIVSKKKSTMPERKVCLAMAIVKKDTFELITEKATELGVSEIIPLIAERSEKKSIRMDRLEKITIEAAEQSGRGDVPFVHDALSVKDFLENPGLENYGQKIIFHVGAEKVEKSVTDFLKNTESDLPTLLCIGPEGGWSDSEVSQFIEKGFNVQSLGNLTLRAETAAIAVLSLYNFRQ